jgi:hypothetical protein
MANTLVVWLTGVIALAIVAYVVVTALLWRATKQSADAAKASADAAKLSADAASVSADAAKKSADISSALHRPYLGVCLFRRHNDFSSEPWAVHCSVRNYGTLAARDVRVEVAVDRDGRGDFGRGLVCTGWEIAPGAEVSGFLLVSIDRTTRELLPKGEAPMAGHVRVDYSAPDGRSFTHSADFPYNRTTQNFRPERSETTARGR